MFLLTALKRSSSRKFVFAHRARHIRFVVQELALETNILPRIFTYNFSPSFSIPRILHIHSHCIRGIYSWPRSVSQFHATNNHSTEKIQKNVWAFSHCCWPILYYSTPERQIVIAVWMRRLPKNFGRKNMFLVLNPAAENMIGILVPVIFKKVFSLYIMALKVFPW